MKTAYLDCFSGVSGDMLLGALIDSGLPETELRKTISGLNLPGCEVAIAKVTDQSFAATRVRVTVPDEKTHRRLADIEKIVTSSDLAESVRLKVLAVFHSLAEAEAAVHGSSVDKVHFHEVGAADAIIDIIGVVHGFFLLGITQLSCSPLPVPHGWVHCAHGDLPVPAPAVCRLLQGKPVYGVDLEQELITPTGAALLHVLAKDFGPMPPMRLASVGYGAGTNKRGDRRPNLLRLVTGETHSPDEAQQVEVLETALDDWNPETWPHVSEQLFKNGALDVILIPVHMKKGRPGFLLRVISEPVHALILKQLILAETSAIGLRFHTENRMTLPREIISVQTKFGPVKAKKIEAPGGTIVTPEFEDCRRIAIEQDISIRDVYREVTHGSDSFD